MMNCMDTVHGQQAYRYLTRHSPTHTHTHTHTWQALSTHTHTGISTHPGPPECLFWGMRGQKKSFEFHQIKSNSLSQNTVGGRAERRRQEEPGTKESLPHKGTWIQWVTLNGASSSPEYQGWNSRVPYRREHPNYYPEKPGRDRCNLLLLNVSALRKLHMVTNSPSLSRLSRVWKWIKKLLYKQKVSLVPCHELQQFLGKQLWFLFRIHLLLHCTQF